MNSVIDRLLNGQFDNIERTLSFSLPRLELNIKPGEVFEGSFTIYGPKDRAVQGLISTSELRMQVLTADFSGYEYEVGFRFDGTGLSAGDVIKGEFGVISNQGEYQLPFVVNVEISHVMSSMGPIRNMFHFVNLAKTDWDEARKLFYSDEFIDVFQESDSSFESLYRGLSAVPMSEANMEEFLIAIKKKQPVAYIPDRTEIVIDNPTAVSEHTIMIARNGWGYTHLEVEFDGKFLEADSIDLTDSDFLGNNCFFKFRVDASKLHDGNNFGAITFRTPYIEVKIPVTAKVNLGIEHLSTIEMEKKKLTVELVKLYENFRCKKIGSREWLSESGRLVNRMNAVDAMDPAFRLYTAQYLITASRVSEGKWILEQMKNILEEEYPDDDTLYCYYLYLTTLVERDEYSTNEVSRMMEGIFSRNSDNWRIAWLLLFISEEYASSPTSRWVLLEQQFQDGCRSPIIYIEAINLMTESPVMLSKMGEFELQTLRYGVKKGILQQNLVDHIIYLGSKERYYNDKLAKILMACYELRKDKESLDAICSLLIKGNRTDPEAFNWYALGVEEELHITRLYEYYMASIYLDEDGMLPCEISKMVLMFFSYQSDLDYEKNAILYRYLHEHRDEYPDLYDSYRLQIEKYLLEQVDKGRINKDLGYLYKNLLTRQMVDASNCDKVLKILYSNEIRTDNKRMNRVIVVYDKLEQEVEYPLNQGVAYVPLYGSDYSVFLADADDNRFAEGIPFVNQKLMLVGQLASYAIPYIQKGQESVELFLCEIEKNSYTITMENVGRFRELAGDPKIRTVCRRNIRESLIRFYYENNFERQLAEYMDEVTMEDLGTADRSSMFELMVMSGNYDMAYNLVRRFGTHKLDPRIVMRLFGRLMDNDALENTEENAKIAWYAFSHAKYDEQLLTFLAENYFGTVKEMRDLWKTANNQGIEVFELTKRILTQILYTGAHIGDKIALFRSYVEKSGGGDELERAFLAKSANDYFVDNMVTDSYVFERIGVLAREGIELLDVCMMAYLRSFTEANHDQLKPDSDIVKEFLKKLLAKDIYFAFFMHYQNELPEMQQFCDKSIIEYRTNPGTKCIVHYISSEDEDEEYKTMPMQEMYSGIYDAWFILFFGEQIQYYITEEDYNGRGERLTESGTISKSDIVQESISGRYSIINDIMIGKTLQDYDTVDRLLSEYYRKRFLTSKLFRTL
ncbi:DUF5717 family protein [Butyrivibrio sp. VCD2006]|uniref:DUF5717 family protein n=1 Tax=Butyrivibrio sp. VCD2006 TaxID=1280664 RepID=UPI0003F50518|nr:DUF5717 family protein [Butyrivibrio sp. VCD2006]